MASLHPIGGLTKLVERHQKVHGRTPMAMTREITHTVRFRSAQMDLPRTWHRLLSCEELPARSVVMWRYIHGDITPVPSSVEIGRPKLLLIQSYLNLTCGSDSSLGEAYQRGCLPFDFQIDLKIMRLSIYTIPNRQFRRPPLNLRPESNATL